MRGIIVKIHRCGSTLALAVALFAAPSWAQQAGPITYVGFLKSEISRCDNCSTGLVNPSTFDPRGVLSPPTPMVNQAGPSGYVNNFFGLAGLVIEANHEFDNAFAINAQVGGRARNRSNRALQADIFGHYLTDVHVGVSHPKWGFLQIGQMPARVWSRPDSFAYPVGLSSPWAETGAGYGLLPQALRYDTPQFEFSFGKIRFEATVATAHTRQPLNPETATARAPKPWLAEGFIQYSNAKNLVELIYQQSRGGTQSSFAKGALTGSIGNTETEATAPGYRPPSENVLILEGTHYPVDRVQLSYGLRRSDWSGQQQQCDFSTKIANCFFDQGSFNYASDGRLHRAVTYDYFGGGTYGWRSWTFSAGGVLLNKAYTKTPTEYGQSNRAVFLNLGVYRKLPELSKNLEVYGGLGRIMFHRQGPAPLSMPNNTADGGVDPRISKSGNTLTLGVTFRFGNGNTYVPP